MATSGVGHELARIRAVVWKDLRAERRTKANFNSVLAMAGLVLLLFGFALGPDTEALRGAAAGVLWLTILFSGVLAFNRSYQLELEGGAFEQLLLYPGERASLFIGKVVANLVFVALVEAVTIPLAAVLYQVSVPGQWGRLAAVLALGTTGFVTLGTFYAAMASRTRAREVLLPLLLFPMLVPVVIGATEATKAILDGDVMGNSGAWLRLVGGFDLLFLLASTWAFEHVVGD
jgi:heme exporter protein B